MKELDHFYLSKEEPIKGCLLSLRKIILSQDIAISEKLKYGMPFFCYKEKMFCYLWVHKKYNQPYIGIVEGNHFNTPLLIQEKRSRMKIMLLNPTIDLPITSIEFILQQALNLYKSAVI